MKTPSWLRRLLLVFAITVCGLLGTQQLAPIPVHAAHMCLGTHQVTPYHAIVNGWGQTIGQVSGWQNDCWGLAWTRVNVAPGTKAWAGISSSAGPASANFGTSGQVDSGGIPLTNCATYTSYGTNQTTFGGAVTPFNWSACVR